MVYGEYVKLNIKVIIYFKSYLFNYIVKFYFILYVDDQFQMINFVMIKLLLIRKRNNFFCFNYYIFYSVFRFVFCIFEKKNIEFDVLVLFLYDVMKFY